MVTNGRSVVAWRYGNEDKDGLPIYMEEYFGNDRNVLYLVCDDDHRYIQLSNLIIMYLLNGHS